MLRKKWSDVGSARVLRTRRLQIMDGKGRLRGVFGTGCPFGSGVHLGIGEGWEQEDDITLLTLKRSASLS